MDNETGNEQRRANIAAGLFAGVAGFGLGMAVMFFLDPARGARRRALVSDKWTSAKKRIPLAARTTARDIANRTRGTFAEVSHLFYHDGASDPVVEARVRSKLGRVCSHPHSVHATSRDGHVVLDGVILAPEVDDVICSVASVRGVKSVENRMRSYTSDDHIPSLQGEALKHPHLKSFQRIH